MNLDWTAVPAARAHAHRHYGVQGWLFCFALANVLGLLLSAGLIVIRLQVMGLTVEDLRGLHTPVAAFFKVAMAVQAATVLVVLGLMAVRSPRFRTLSTVLYVGAGMLMGLPILLNPFPGSFETVVETVLPWLLFCALSIPYLQRSRRVRVTFEHLVHADEPGPSPRGPGTPVVPPAAVAVDRPVQASMGRVTAPRPSATPVPAGVAVPSPDTQPISGFAPTEARPLPAGAGDVPIPAWVGRRRHEPVRPGEPDFDAASLPDSPVPDPTPREGPARGDEPGVGEAWGRRPWAERPSQGAGSGAGSGGGGADAAQARPADPDLNWPSTTASPPSTPEPAARSDEAPTREPPAPRDATRPGDAPGASPAEARTATPAWPADESFWALALEEVEGPGRRAGLWARSFAGAGGDEVRAKVAYLNARVAELTREHQATQVADAAARRAEAVAAAEAREIARHQTFELPARGRCPHCDTIQPIVSRRCPRCRADFGPDSASRLIVER